MRADIYALLVKASLLVDLIQQWQRNCKKIILKQTKFNRPEQNGLTSVKLSYIPPLSNGASAFWQLRSLCFFKRSFCISIFSSFASVTS